MLERWKDARHMRMRRGTETHWHARMYAKWTGISRTFIKFVLWKNDKVPHYFEGKLFQKILIVFVVLIRYFVKSQTPNYGCKHIFSVQTYVVISLYKLVFVIQKTNKNLRKIALVNKIQPITIWSWSAAFLNEHAHSLKQTTVHWRLIAIFLQKQRSKQANLQDIIAFNSPSNCYICQCTKNCTLQQGTFKCIVEFRLLRSCSMRTAKTDTTCWPLEKCIVRILAPQRWHWKACI